MFHITYFMCNVHYKSLYYFLTFHPFSLIFSYCVFVLMFLEVRRRFSARRGAPTSVIELSPLEIGPFGCCNVGRCMGSDMTDAWKKDSMESAWKEAGSFMDLIVSTSTLATTTRLQSTARISIRPIQLHMKWSMHGQYSVGKTLYWCNHGQRRANPRVACWNLLAYC